MSATPHQSPLGINILGSVLQNTGLSINSGASGYVGTSTSLTTYTPGTLVSTTVLQNITVAIDLAYGHLGADITGTTFLNLLNCGSTTVPALANGRPTAYTRTITVTATSATTNQITCTSTENLETGSAIMFTGAPFGGLLANTTYWVSTVDTPSKFTVSLTNGGPVVALVNASGAMVLENFALLRWGFIRTLALQAYNEFNWNSALPQYTEFLASIATSAGFIEQSNSTIRAVNNSTTFLSGVYSNMNDLISGDISGVNLSTMLFGQDLIALGRAIDLSTISTFGMPGNLLLTLKNNRAVTRALTLAIMASGVDPSEFSTLLSDPRGAPIETQRKLYGAYSVIVARDLEEICILLNCKTRGLRSLADLLDLKYLFPLSGSSLTVPINNTVALPTNSKTYYPIYRDGAINPALLGENVLEAIGTIIPPGAPSVIPREIGGQLQPLPRGFGSYLSTVLPLDIATACGAFSTSMQQIKNIESVPIEKFAQVAGSVETARGLDIGGTSVPVDTTLAASAIASLALGSGPGGTYRAADFFGCMSGTPYNYSTVQSALGGANTAALATTYASMVALLSGAGPYNAALGVLITAANTNIATIATLQPAWATNINALWDEWGTQLTIEQNARQLALGPSIVVDPDVPENRYPTTQIQFVDSIGTLALDVTPSGWAQTLEAISDWTTVGGRSIVGLGRESRNTARLREIGIEIDNTIPDQPTQRQQRALIANGASNLITPLLPTPLGSYNTTTNQYVVSSGTLGGTALDVGRAVPGSLAGSPYINLLPAELNNIYASKQLSGSTYTPSEALAEVEICNCDCWQ